MGSKAVAVVLVVILALGNAYLYFELADARSRLEQYISRYAELSKEYSTLYSAHTSLQHRYSELLAGYDKLLQVKEELEAEVSRLSSTVATLTSENSALRQQVAGLQEENAKLMKSLSHVQEQVRVLSESVSLLEVALLSLNATLASFATELLQYATLPHGFKRTLTAAEIDRIAPYMHEVQLYPDDPWRSFNNIYSYVVNKIRYSRDQWIPTPVSTICKLVAGLRVCEYQLMPFSQVVQTPYETLVRGEGDCEDQAILLYAMIQYYFKYVHKKSYTVWIALIMFSDGSAHAAVFIPVQGGELTILDPAGRYKTSMWGYIFHRPALDELLSYSVHWSANGGVKWIELYYVNIATGDYILSAEGDIYAIANYIAK